MRPDVRMIEPQSEQTTPANISSWEAEQLLRKYGHQPEQFSTYQQPDSPVNDLTFDQMIAQQETQQKEEQIRKKQQMNGPKPMTFNSQNGYSSEVRYASDDDTGFGFKIEVTTDMQLPRY